MKKLVFILLLGIVVFAVSTPALAAFQTYTFDTDAQGWMFASGGDYSLPSSVAGPTVYWDTRGNTGGALSAPDVHYQTFVAAPSVMLGDQSDMYGKSFSYDMFVRYTDNVAYAAGGITGGGLSLVFIPSQLPTVGVWETWTVTFNEAMWRVGGTAGAVATADQLKTALGNMTGLYLLTEWHTGADDTSIDNFNGRSSTVPIPAAAWLLGSGLLGLLGFKRKFSK
jgi:hypothetical protein